MPLSDKRRPPGYLDLLDDLEQPGCPACRAARRSAERLIGGILDESVNDPSVRGRLRQSHGFCPDHSLLALRLVGVEGQAIALLYGDFLRHIREKAVAAAEAVGRRQLGRRRTDAETLAPQGACRACEVARERSELYLELLARAEPDDELGRAAREVDRGLCVPHLSQGLGAAGGRRQAERLLDIYLRGEEQIRADLEEYLRKQDHRFSSEPKGREQGSWRRALMRVIGPVSRGPDSR